MPFRLKVIVLIETASIYLVLNETASIYLFIPCYVEASLET